MQKQLITDKQLVSRYIKGDESALAILVNRYKQSVFDYIQSFVKDEEKAEDIFQDTFMKVITTLKKGGYKEQGKFLPWVLFIARNLVMDYFRNKKKKKTISFIKRKDGKVVDIFDTIHVPEPTRENDFMDTHKRKRVRTLVRCLDRELQEVIILRHNFGMTFREIAEQSDLSINTILGRMHSAIKKLNIIIKEQEINFDSKRSSSASRRPMAPRQCSSSASARAVLA